MFKIKKDDEVVVIAGQDKGKIGKILKVYPKTKRVVVENVNMRKKHIRPNPAMNIEGGIKTKEYSIHISNVAIYNPTTKKADRVGFKILENGTKARYYKKTQDIIEQV